MNKISKRIVKYIFLTNLIVVFVGLILTSFILPKLYISNEYLSLESKSKYVIEAAKNNIEVDLENIYAVLINDNKVTNMSKDIGNRKGYMGQPGVVNKIQQIDFESFSGRAVFKDKKGNSYIGIKIYSEYGEIVIYKSYEEIRSLIKSVNLIIILIFIFSIMMSIFISYYLGNRFTKPIIQLQKRALDISKGDYKNNLNISTKDEIEDLNISIDKMARELERKDNMQKEFISNITHDLKTPLSVIRANSEIIKDGLIDGEEVSEYASNIIGAVDMLANLVEEILVLSKLRDNNKIINPINSSLEEFIKDSFKKLNNIESDNIKLILKKDIDIKSIYVPIDSNYLFRVLINFFINAIKHSGNVKNEIIFGIRKDKEDIQIYIKDFGKGIESGVIENIWDRYYKGESSGGIGLGLAISKEIILAHKFNYGVKSNVGKGSEFYFSIPQELVLKI